MSDKQTTALVLFLLLAFALYLNNTPSVNQSGNSKLAEILGIIRQGLSAPSGIPPITPGTGPAIPGLGAGVINGRPDVNLPAGYYSPQFLTDLTSIMQKEYDFQTKGGAK